MKNLSKKERDNYLALKRSLLMSLKLAGVLKRKLELDSKLKLLILRWYQAN